MKIAVWHNLPSGGGNRALAFHLKGLKNLGHYIELWCPSTADNTFAEIHKWVDKINVVPLSLTDQKYKFFSWADWRTSIFWQKTKLMQAMETHCMACAADINKKNFDVLFANSCQFFFNSFIGRFVTIPSLIYLGEPNRMLYEAYPNQMWIAPYKLKLKKLFKEMCWANFYRVVIREEIANFNAYDKVLVNSYYSNESIIKAYGKGGNVCYLGIDTNLFKVIPNENKLPIVIGLGTIYHTKGIETAVEAIGKMKHNKPKLIWVGNGSDGNYKTQINLLANSLKVEIEFLEFIDDDALVRLLNQATCMLYTSKLEPFGLAPLEANACGCPVVGVAEGGIRETIKHELNGYLIERDAQKIAAYLDKIFANKELSNSLSQNAIKNIEVNWSAERGIKNIETELMGLLKKHN
jgi:glycosyltransferase involved in cell wall biosynthesis